MITDQAFWLMMEGDIIKTLLGDIPTFTTEQYASGFEKWMRKNCGEPPEDWSNDLEKRRSQLRALAPLVIETQPDVWVYQGERSFSETK